MARRTFYEVAMVLLVSVLLSFSAYLIRPDALPLISSGQEKPVEEELDGIAIISFKKAREMHQQKQAVFIDARTLDSYEKGHIEGSINLVPGEFEEWSEQIIEKFQLDQTFITYCDGPKCPLARDLAEKLTWLGFELVFYISDGWAKWEKAKLPTTTGGSE
ncbi:MAG: rhodanese-like domain-containing protein [Desulfobacteraceae bacterium]|nr:rhodanese-like domain-containing protein [Desulfobacteraceae bacterium]